MRGDGLLRIVAAGAAICGVVALVTGSPIGASSSSSGRYFAGVLLLRVERRTGGMAVRAAFPCHLLAAQAL